MIREASRDDLPALVAMGERFALVGTEPLGVPMDTDTVLELLCHLLDVGVVLVSEEAGKVVGMIGGKLVPWPFNANFQLAQEVFWWADPAAADGMALLEAFEDAVTEMGADVIAVSCLAGLRAPALGRVFRRRGYIPSELAFVRRV